MVGRKEIGIAYLVDDVLAGQIKRCAQFCLYLAEVVIDGLLQKPALGLHRIFQRKFFDSILNLILIQLPTLSLVIMLLLHAQFAATRFFGRAAICHAKVGDFLVVLASVHPQIL